jgi:hypothetical protein
VDSSAVSYVASRKTKGEKSLHLVLEQARLIAISR